MKKAIIVFKDGKYCNVEADYMTYHGEHLLAYKDDNIVAFVHESDVKRAYLSESKNGD